MLKRFRERAGSESGFTLIELLVVMLILGILAAIAIPAFLNQKSKATDASGKAMARSMQTAMETCSTDNNGQYTNCAVGALTTIEPTIVAGGQVTAVSEPVAPTATTYTVRATVQGGRTFDISRAGAGTITRACAPNGGGCVALTW